MYNHYQCTAAYAHIIGGPLAPDIRGIVYLRMSRVERKYMPILPGFLPTARLKEIPRRSGLMDFIFMNEGTVPLEIPMIPSKEPEAIGTPLISPTAIMREIFLFYFLTMAMPG